MHNSEVQKHNSYGEFFMSGRRGRKSAHGAQSTMDSVIYNRDIDRSGDAPHESNMSRFAGHAGKASAPKSDRPFRKPGISMASTMDTVIWGRDFDKSGHDPHDQFLKNFSQHAGRPAGFAPMVHHQHRPQRKGAYAMKSTMDDVLFGRDLDNSGADPREHFEQTYNAHAGVRTVNSTPRPFRKPTFAQQTMADEVIFGRDQDMSGPSPHKDHMAKNFKEHAGLKTDERVARPYRKTGISMQATVDDVVFHRDIDGSGEDPQVALFSTMYVDHAGRKSGGPRTVAKHVDPRDPSFAKNATGTTMATTGDISDSARCDCSGRARSQPPPKLPLDDGPAAGLTSGRPLSARVVRAPDVGSPAHRAAELSQDRRSRSTENLKRVLSARELPSSQGGAARAIFVDARSAARPAPSDAGSAASRPMSNAASQPCLDGIPAAGERPRSRPSSRAPSSAGGERPGWR